MSTPFIPPLPEDFFSPTRAQPPLRGEAAASARSPRDPTAGARNLAPHSAYGPSVAYPPNPYASPYGQSSPMPPMYGGATPYNPGMGLPPGPPGPGSYYPPPSHHATPFQANTPLHGMGGRAPPVSSNWLGYNEYGQVNMPYGQQPYGQQPYGQQPYGQQPYGTPHMGMGMPPMQAAPSPYFGAQPQYGGHAPMPGAYPGTPWGATPQNLPGMGLPGMGPPQARPRIPPFTEPLPRFLEGPGLGPVLEPIQVSAVGARLQINPLLCPPNLDHEDIPHLVWNLTQRTSYCRRSDEGVGRSWAKGRQEPATVPRVSRLSLVTIHVPWTFDIVASDPEFGVTCADLVEQLSQQLRIMGSRKGFEGLAKSAQLMISQAYQDNRSSKPGRAGGELGMSLLRLDYLGKSVWWGGIVNDPKIAKGMSGGVEPPCTLVLKCEKPMNSEAEMQSLLDRPSTAQPPTSSVGSSSDPSEPASGPRSRTHSRTPSSRGGT